jgi:hypothetical protein
VANTVCLLRMRGERPCRTAKQDDEISPLHDFFPSQPTTPTMGYTAFSGKHGAVRQDLARMS